MKTMTKEQEIKILESLIGDTYFNDYFSTEDIETMCYNIKNDLPLGLDCTFARKAEIAKKLVTEEQKIADQEILNIAEKMMIAVNNGESSMPIIESKIGIDNTIRIKHKNDIPLSKDELDYLVKKLG